MFAKKLNDGKRRDEIYEDVHFSKMIMTDIPKIVRSSR